MFMIVALPGLFSHPFFYSIDSLCQTACMVILWFIVLKGNLVDLLSLFILYIFFCFVMMVLSSSRCLGKAGVCNCGTPWTFLLPFFPL